MPRREWLSRGCPGGMQLSRRLGGGGKQQIDPRVCSDRIGRTVVTQVREGYEAQWSFSPYTDTDLLRAVARRRIVSEWWGTRCAADQSSKDVFIRAKQGEDEAVTRRRVQSQKGGREPVPTEPLTHNTIEREWRTSEGCPGWGKQKTTEAQRKGRHHGRGCVLGPGRLD